MKTRLSNWALLVVITAGVVVLLVLAVFLVNREDASSLASAAETAMVADNALSVATAIRTASTYAAYLGSETSDSQSLVVLDEIEAASVDLAERVDRLAESLDPETASELSVVSNSFISATGAFVEQLASSTGDAQEALDSQEGALSDFSTALVRIRDTHVESVLVAGDDVGRAANMVRILVVFVIPIAMILGVTRILRKSSERRLLASELERQSQLVQSKDDFVADVSHELRTPLTGIYGFAVALEESSENLDELQSELLGLIITESNELSRMVDDLVALGRIDAGAVTYQFEYVDVAGTVEQAVAPFRRQGISFEHDAEGLTVWADPGRFRQVLRNLISNAVKYGDGEVAVGVTRTDDHVVVEVIDNGPGVPEEVAHRLFERYVHRDGTALLEGSVGLGLAIAQSFAEGMNGKLRYLREDGLTIFQLQMKRSTGAGSKDGASTQQEVGSEDISASINEVRSDAVVGS